MLPKRPPRDHRVGFIYSPPWRIQGISVGGEQTVIQVPELGVNFDIGLCPRIALASEFTALSHGHMDHDGSCPPVIRKSGAELWAHEIYGYMLQADRGNVERGWRKQVLGFKDFENSETRARVMEHRELNRDLILDHPVTDQCTGHHSR